MFFQSVKRRLRSDVPVGSSLSGGLDSSSIVCAISQLTKDSRISQNSFSARFKDFDKDEGTYIEKVLAKTGIKGNDVWPDEVGFLADFENLCFHQEEPFPTASIYAQYTVMRLAKEKNVTVLLDGQGADETLAGYEYYFNTFLQELYLQNESNYDAQRNLLVQMHPRFEMKDFKNIAGANSTKQTTLERLKNLLRPLYKKINSAKYDNLDLRSFSQQRRDNLFNKEFLNQFTPEDIFKVDATFNTLNGHLKHSLFVNNLEDLLRFSDRNSMAFSREVRLPFLNHELVEFLFSLPSNFKVHDGWSKYVLRKSMEGILPDEITWRKDKIGYEPPQTQWMKHIRIKEQVNDIRSQLINRKIIHKDAILSEDQEFAFLNIANFT
jgi:asparagine synthase (glutamine-hydrolysing)